MLMQTFHKTDMKHNFIGTPTTTTNFLQILPHIKSGTKIPETTIRKYI